ncbi:chlorohydrolase [Streptococcus pneumoniae]|nr:chlorohydrolase [Streptococcus pneumoniae]
MKIKEQTRKVTAGCSKHCFKVVDGTDEVSSKHCFEVVDRTDEVSSKHCFEVVDRTDEVSNHTYGKATLTWFEEIFEEYKFLHNKTHITKVLLYRPDNMRFSFLFNVGCLIGKGDNGLLQFISTKSAELFNFLVDDF